MENLRKRKSKKTLIAKISILVAFALIISLFGVVIAQSVRIAKLNNEFEKTKNSYQAETAEENE